MNDETSFIGLGLLYNKYIFTCWHIFSDSNSLKNQPLQTFILSFPLASYRQQIEAHLIYVSKDDDLVILETTQDITQPTQDFLNQYSSDLWGHKFRAFGFPNYYDDGVWTSGEIIGIQTTGWIQLETTKLTGYQIAKGFSGSPVWDENLKSFVGIIIAADKDKVSRVGYMLPLIRYFVVLKKLQEPTLKRDRIFFGRETELNVLDSWANSDSFVLTITGIGGIGKTALIKEFSRTNNFEHIWISAGDITNFNLEKLSFTYWAQTGSNEIGTNSVELMIGHLRRNHILIVLDNFETISLEDATKIVSFIRNIWEPNIKSKFVITSRVPIKELDNWILSKELKLTKGLLYKDALNFIDYLANSKGIENLEREILFELITISEGHPKLLEVLLGTIKRKGRKALKQVLRKKDRDFGESLDSILHSSFAKLTNMQKHFIYYACFLGTQSFYQEEIKALSQDDNTTEILEQLVDLGLVNFSYHSALYSIHQLIIDYFGLQADGFAKSESSLLLRLYNYYAKLLKQKGTDEFSANIENLLALIEKFLGQDDILHAGNLILKVCDHLEQTGQLNKAVYILKRGLVLAEKADSLSYKKDFYFLIGKFYYLLDDLVSSQISFMAFHKLSKDEINFQHAFALHHLAITSFYPRSSQSSSDEKVFSYLRQSLIYYHKLGMKLYVAYVLNDMSSQIKYYGNVSLAFKWLNSSMNILSMCKFETKEHKKIVGMIFRSTSHTYFETGDFINAQHYIKISIKFLEESNNFWELGHALYVYSQVMFKIGDINMAKSLLEKQIKLISVIGKVGQFCHAYYSLGNIYLNLDQPEQAYLCYQRGYDLALDLQVDLQVVDSLIYIGEYMFGKLMLSQKNFKEAIAHFTKSIQMRIKSNHVHALPIVYLLLAESYFKDGDNSKARETLELFYTSGNIDSIYSRSKELYSKAENLLSNINNF